MERKHQHQLRQPKTPQDSRFYREIMPKSEWDPAKKFKMPYFPDESDWQCPLCDKMMSVDEIHIDNCPFLTLEK